MPYVLEDRWERYALVASVLGGWFCLGLALFCAFEVKKIAFWAPGRFEFGGFIDLVITW